MLPLLLPPPLFFRLRSEGLGLREEFTVPGKFKISRALFCCLGVVPL